MPKQKTSILSRLSSKITIDQQTGCWLWTASLKPNGYGQRWDGYKLTWAHRAVYEALRGAIPQGLVLDHLCRIPRCVNPEHLEAVTPLVNAQRGIGQGNPVLKNKTRCLRGHEFTEENTYLAPNRKYSTRVCRLCARLRQRDFIFSDSPRFAAWKRPVPSSGRPASGTLPLDC